VLLAPLPSLPGSSWVPPRLVDVLAAGAAAAATRAARRGEGCNLQGYAEMLRETLSAQVGETGCKGSCTERTKKDKIEMERPDAGNRRAMEAKRTTTLSAALKTNCVPSSPPAHQVEVLPSRLSSALSAARTQDQVKYHDLNEF